MSHIAVDLKVIEGLAAAAARASDTNEERVGWGLVRLWHRTWSDKLLTRTRAELAGVFGIGNLEALILALIDFGFLELMSDASYRVRGAARYLRLKAALARGGKLSAKNLKRGVLPGSRAGEAPGPQPGLFPALPPNTEHRTPKKEKTAGEKPPAAPDPRHAPLVAQLVAASPGYSFGARDAKQVTTLLQKGPPDEVIRRWKRALTWPGTFPRVRSLSELVAFWNHFTADSPNGLDPNSGIIRTPHPDNRPTPPPPPPPLPPELEIPL